MKSFENLVAQAGISLGSSNTTGVYFSEKIAVSSNNTHNAGNGQCGNNGCSA